ncbi:hypothetical protein [Adhaeretor mobilis]|uniref:hypothetical protein n=1 Tax=Adhaeretor mobilis TaxID=1930276 RepID=UPI0011A80A4C|nr:hypothetical protein [Adhaeretor mobilis]
MAKRAKTKAEAKAYQIEYWRAYFEAFGRRDLLEGDVLSGWEHEKLGTKVGQPYTPTATQ